MSEGLELAGQVVGNYRVRSRLGAGGMGEVWLAEHSLLGHPVALKFLLPSVSQQTDAVDRFFDEARAATRIADPGIVRVHDFGRHAGSAYIAMEYVDGETLSTRLARLGRLPLLAALRLARHTAMTMAAVHARGIVHRDLKPDNLFAVADAAVPGGERIKILDFGIAKLLDEPSAHVTRTRTGAILGTPLYMSPEQCRSAGTVDQRTDIYALAGVLYHLVCGRPPFTASTPAELIASHLMETPSPPSTWLAVPHGVDQLIIRCLAKAQGDRFSTMAEMALALERAIEVAVDRETNQPIAIGSRSPSDIGSLATLANDARAAVTPRSRYRRSILGAIALTALVAAVVIAIVAIVTARSGWRSDRAPAADAQELTDAASSTPTPLDAVMAEPPPSDSAIADAAPLDARGAFDAGLRKRPVRKLPSRLDLYENP